MCKCFMINIVYTNSTCAFLKYATGYNVYVMSLWCDQIVRSEKWFNKVNAVIAMINFS